MRGQRRVGEQLAEIVGIRPGQLLGAQRPAPLEQEILAVHRGPPLEGGQRRRRVDDRTDRDDARDADAGPRRPRADPQAEIAAQRKAGQRQARVRIQRLQAADRADDLRDAAGMEQLAVERVAAAMVAQVQAHDGEATLVQHLGDRQQVQRVGTALPAVQQHREPARRERALRVRIGRPCQQADTVAAIEDQLAARRQHRAGPPLDRTAPHRQARKHRLQVAIAEPGRRPELEVQVTQRRSATPPAAS